jgi:transcription elongation factor Elf1
LSEKYIPSEEDIEVTFQCPTIGINKVICQRANVKFTIIDSEEEKTNVVLKECILSFQSNF